MKALRMILGAMLILVVGVGCSATRPMTQDVGPLDWSVPAAAPVATEQVTAAPESATPGVDRTAPASLQESYQALLAQEPVGIGKHKVNGMVGYTSDRGGGGFTLGLQYEYMMQEKFGIGALVDVVFANRFSTVLAAAFYFHPADRWTIVGAPGVEFISSSSRVIARVGGSYEFPVKGFTIAPAVYVDLNAREGTPIFGGAYISKKF